MDHTEAATTDRVDDESHQDQAEAALHDPRIGRRPFPSFEPPQQR